MSKSTRDWLLDAEGSLRPPLDACPLRRNWAAAEVPQVRDVLASGYGPGYGSGDAISIVFEQPTAAGLDEEARRGLTLTLTTLTLTLTRTLTRTRTPNRTRPRGHSRYLWSHAAP